MTLGEFKNHVQSFLAEKTFDYSISEPFSWRGAYAEVAFTVENLYSTREDILGKIDKALNDEFVGWKGGDFKYNENTYIHFEGDEGNWSDGQYTENWIAKILGLDKAKTPQERLVKLMFK